MQIFTDVFKLFFGSALVAANNPLPTRPSADGTNPVDSTHPLYTQPTGAVVSGPTTLANAQDFTAGWVNLGAEIDVRSAKLLVLWLNLDINNSLNARITVLLRNATGGSNFLPPNCAFSATDIKVTAPAYWEFDTDADQLVAIPVPLDYGVLYAQVQVQAGTVGATAGHFDTAQYTLVK